MYPNYISVPDLKALEASGITDAEALRFLREQLTRMINEANARNTAQYKLWLLEWTENSEQRINNGIHPDPPPPPPPGWHPPPKPKPVVVAPPSNPVGAEFDTVQHRWTNVGSHKVGDRVVDPRDGITKVLCSRSAFYGTVYYWEIAR